VGGAALVGGRWQRAKGLSVSENIQRIFQPAYSPAVNLVEYRWEEVREKYLHDRIFSFFNDLAGMRCQALHALTEEQGRLGSRMFFPHFSMEKEIVTSYAIPVCSQG
jgi:hypothetical protein